MSMTNQWTKVWLVAMLTFMYSNLLADEHMAANETNQTSASNFNYQLPSTYENGTTSQQNTLKQIAETEFTLEHLDSETQDLVSEALSKSGIEVSASCTVERAINGSIGAFFTRTNHEEVRTFHPYRGRKIQKEDESDQSAPEWQPTYGATALYAYPFSEDELLPRVIPVDLSSIQLVERDDYEYRFSGMPSRFLTVGLTERDRILAEEHLNVQFVVDAEFRRVTRQVVRLVENVRVYFGIKIKNFEVSYEFGQDSNSDRHVLQSVHQKLAGTVWLAFRPNVDVSSEMTYYDCQGESLDRSFLFQAMDAIAKLD